MISCETCKFRGNAVTGDLHECRLNPPDRVRSRRGEWPLVALGDWCGGHKPVSRATQKPIETKG